MTRITVTAHSVIDAVHTKLHLNAINSFNISQKLSMEFWGGFVLVRWNYFKFTSRPREF